MSVLMRDQFIREMTDELQSSTTLGLKMGDAWKQVFNMKKTDKRRVESQAFVWPSTVAETAEGGPLNRLVVNHGFMSVVIPITYTGEIKISHEFIADIRYDEVKAQSFGLGVAFTRNRYKLACDEFVNGFSSSTSPDGLPLFSPVHKLAVNQNPAIPTGNYLNSYLDTDAFDAGRIMLETVADENGELLPIPINTVRLIIPPNLVRTAHQITGSTHEPENVNNSINVYSQQYGMFNVEIVSLPFLYSEAMMLGYTSWAAKQWYMQIPEYHGMEFWEREAIQTWMVRDDATLCVLHQGYDRFGFRIFDWRYSIGSQGGGG